MEMVLILERTKSKIVNVAWELTFVINKHHDYKLGHNFASVNRFRKVFFGVSGVRIILCIKLHFLWISWR